MLAPLSWLKDYVEITLDPTKLGERLTEVGLGTEKITKVDNDVIFELEITPNRPDLLSIVGIAREIAAIEGKRIKFPGVIERHLEGVIETALPLKIETDFKINPRFTGIIIDGITVRESPDWLKERLIKIGQRPINNIVDITNYVMFELGNPIHAFDYDKIVGHQMVVHQTKGGEEFKSVDSLNYKLPKGTVVISDQEKIIDLCGIKGGENSGTFEGTKTIFVRVPVEVPALTRRASQALGLRSEASSIFERGVNAGGTKEALERCVDLILELAGGEIVSDVYDLKKSRFLPWKLKLRILRLNQILGIPIKTTEIISFLKRLNLQPKKMGDVIEVTVPTYRNDLRIEEDLIEEVARLYGYNNFPKTLPVSGIPVKQIPYFKNYRFEEAAKQILTAAGFSEIYTYSLVSENDLVDVGYNPRHCLRVDNPVSREFEYLRPTLKVGLMKALKQNEPYFGEINLFELGKVYRGKNLSEFKEQYVLSGISNKRSFYEVKGVIERLFWELNVKEDPSKLIEVVNEGVYFELSFSEILSKTTFKKIFVSLPKYPPIIEDLAIVAESKVKTGYLIMEIKKQGLVAQVSLLDVYKNTRTFHIVYQHKNRNLTNEEVSLVREKIFKTLQKKFGASLKE